MVGDAPIALGLKSWLYSPNYPDHWAKCKLYSMAEWVNGIAFRDIQFSSHGLPVIKIAEIKNGLSEQTKFTVQSFDESVRIRSGDLLFAWSGQPETSIDVFWWRGSPGWLNQHVFRVTPRQGVDPTFFYYLLRYLRPNFIGIARNKQTTGLGHVTKRDLQSLEAAYPSLEQQRAIANVLGTLDDKIELNRKTSDTMETMARSIFKSWFVEYDPVRAKAEGRDPNLPEHVAGLFPNSLENSGPWQVPRGWTVVPLTNVVDVNPRRSLRKGETAPYLDMANMPTRGHSPAAVINRPFGSGMRFKNGDTLVARITPCLENGKTAFVDFLEDGQVGWGSTEFIVLRPRTPLPAEYAYCLARDEAFREFAIQSMTGSSGRQRVPAESLGFFTVTLPNAEVAEVFGKHVAPMFVRARVASQESRTLAALRDTLLPKLISGEIRAKDAERFVGSAGA